jgi:hypothetical protein
VGIFIEGLPPSAHVPRQGGNGGGGSGVGFGVGGGMGGFGSGMGFGMGGGRRGMQGNNKNLYNQAQIWEEVQLARK